MKTGNGSESKKAGRKRTDLLVARAGALSGCFRERLLTGKRKRLWLATGGNEPAQNPERRNFFALFAARDSADRLAHIAGQLDAAQAQAAILEDAADPGLKIADAFEAYERNPNRLPRRVHLAPVRFPVWAL